MATFMACDISQNSRMILGQFAIVLRIVDTQEHTISTLYFRVIMRKKEYVFCCQSLETNIKDCFELKKKLYVYLSLC